MTTKIWLYGPPAETKELACRLSLIAEVDCAGYTGTGDDPLVCRELIGAPDDGLEGRLHSAAAVLSVVAEDVGGGVAEHLDAAIEQILRATHILEAEASLE